MVSQTGVAGSAGRRPLAVAVDEGLPPLGVVDAAGAAEGGEAPLLRAVGRTPVHGHLEGAAGPRHHPGRVVRGSAGAVAVAAAPVARRGGAV